MITDFSDLNEIIYPFLILSFLFYFLSKRYFNNIFDPYFYGLVVYFTTSTTLMYLVNFDNKHHFYHFIVLIFSFFIGLKLSSSRFFMRLNFSSSDSLYIFEKSNIKIFSNFTLLLFIISLFVQIIIFVKFGFAIASDNPTDSKSSMFEGGGGILRRFLWTVLPYLTICVVLMIFVGYKKIQNLIILFLVIIMLLLSGSKSALLPVLFVVSLLPFHAFFYHHRLIKKVNFFLVIIFIIAFAAAILILGIESDWDFDVAFFKFLNRLLFNGDVVLYYYEQSVYEHFSNLKTYDFFPHILNGPLGMLRLVPYEQPHGYTMVYIYNGGVLPFDSILGPNTPFYVIADIYFGHYFAWFYSLILGFFFGLIRCFYFCYRGRNIFIFSFLIFLLLSSFKLIIEVSLFVSTVFEFFVFISPIFIVYFFIRASQRLNLSVIL